MVLSIGWIAITTAHCLSRWSQGSDYGSVWIVIRLALAHSAQFLEKLRPGLSHGLGAIKLVVPHQPSKVGLRAMQMFGWPAAQTMMTLDRLGNCVAASLPSTLYEAVRGGRIQRGEELLLVGTGAGLSLGGVILTF